jgi:catechol 2,3-dioxygenase-like lactoylglutathione lyase family enzyme
MHADIREKILSICTKKIEEKGEGVQVSFYAFFANKNDDPVVLMDVARWWIEEHELNHFEKATKIYAMVSALGTQSINQKSNINGFNHLTLSVSDLDRSCAFYCDLLGFKGEVRWRTGAYLSYANCWLCLSLGGPPRPSQDYSHFAFTFDELSILMISQNIRSSEVKQWQKNISEGDSFYLEDPDGHKLELHSGSLETRLESLRKTPYDGLIWLP